CLTGSEIGIPAVDLHVNFCSSRQYTFSTQTIQLLSLFMHRHSPIAAQNTVPGTIKTIFLQHPSPDAWIRRAGSSSNVTVASDVACRHRGDEFSDPFVSLFVHAPSNTSSRHGPAARVAALRICSTHRWAPFQRTPARGNL